MNEIWLRCDNVSFPIKVSSIFFDSLMSWPVILIFYTRRAHPVICFIPHFFFSTGKTVCTLDGSLQISLQRQNHGRQFLQFRSSEYSFLLEDAAFKPRSSVNTRADHNWYKPWMFGVPSLSKKVQEQAGTLFTLLHLLFSAGLFMIHILSVFSFKFFSLNW